VSNQSSSTCRASRALRVERVELCCSTMSTQPKCMGSTRRTCRVVSSRAKWNLGLTHHELYWRKALWCYCSVCNCAVHRRCHEKILSNCPGTAKDSRETQVCCRTRNFFIIILCFTANRQILQDSLISIRKALYCIVVVFAFFGVKSLQQLWKCFQFF